MSTVDQAGVHTHAVLAVCTLFASGGSCCATLCLKRAGKKKKGIAPPTEVSYSSSMYDDSGVLVFL